MPRQPARISRSRNNRAVQRRSAQKPATQSRRSRFTRARRSKKSGTNNLLSSLLRLIFAVLISGTLILVFIISWLIPRLILEVDQPKLVLIVPKSISESAEATRLLLVRLDPDGKHTAIQLDGENTVNLGDYGSYKLAMAYPLLQLDDQSEQYVNSVFSQLLELPLDQVLALDPVTSTGDWNGRILSELKKQPSEMLWWQLTYILRMNRKIENPELSTTAITKITKTWPVIDAEQTSQCPIAVSNGTGISGLATYTSNLIERAGGLVIRVATGYEPQKSTSIVVDGKTSECQQVAEIISRFFPTVQISMDTQNLTSEYRSKILVVLGQDMESFTPNESEE